MTGMIVFKKIALLAATTMTICGSALAADLPRRAAPPMVPIAPIFTWTGFYAGVNAGYTATDHAVVRTVGLLPGNAANVAVGARPGAVRLDQDGFTGGGQLGYNYQFGNFVLGLETDIAYTDLDRRRLIIGTGGNPSAFRQSLDFLGTVRGRVGVAFDRVLVYGTGGFAYGDTDYRPSFFNPAGALAFVGRRSNLETGWAAGGGIEYALPTDTFLNFFKSSAVTIKAEYLYYDLGRHNVAVSFVPGVGGGFYASRFETNGHIGRVGVNYKFGTY